MKIIDLSKTISNDMEVYPGDPNVEIKNWKSLEEDNWQISLLYFGSHTGTHADAFSHVAKNSASIDKMSLESFVTKAILVNEVQDIRNNLGLLLNFYGDINILNDLIKANPKFVAGNLSEELERTLLINNIPTITDLVNLDELPVDREFFFVGLPLKIENCDGSPIRAVAILDLEHK